MVQRPNWSERAIPISLHGDAAPAVGVGKAHSKSYDCYSWMSILAHGPTSRVKLYLCGIFEDCKAKASDSSVADTMEEIWRHILWPLLAAYEGVFPMTNANNQPWDEQSLEASASGQELAGGFFLVVWSLKGDLDYFAKGLQLRHYGANEFCEFCPATCVLDVPGLVWTNFGRRCLWTQRLYTKAQRGELHPQRRWSFNVFPFFVAV